MRPIRGAGNASSEAEMVPRKKEATEIFRGYIKSKVQARINSNRLLPAKDDNLSSFARHY